MSRVIVNYSSSEDDLPEDNKTIKRKLPLPNEVKNMYNEKIVKHVDDPNLHFGRIRTFEHEVGNWATLVSIPFENDLKLISEEMIKILRPVSEFKVCQNMHLSLSKTVVLRHHWINSIFEELKSNFKNYKSQNMKLKKIEILSSFEASRTFIALNLETAFCNYISQLVEQVDKVFDGYQLPPFYKPAKFHVSILWCQGDLKDKISNKLLTSLEELLNEAITEDPEILNISSNKISFKTGNKELFIKLLHF